MARTRTFVAIDVGKGVRDRLAALQESLARRASGVKWVEPNNLHLTLLFLGEVEDIELPAVCKAVAEVARTTPAFSMSIEHVGCFPHPRRPRILWVGVGAGAPQVSALHDALELPLLDLGCYRREERQYTPHITLGRVTGDRPPAQLTEALAKAAGWQGGSTSVREVHVMGSELTPQGPLYTVLSRAKCQEAEPS
jgi:2'-5' RNA ligase